MSIINTVLLEQHFVLCVRQCSAQLLFGSLSIYTTLLNKSPKAVVVEVIDMTVGLSPAKIIRKNLQ